eukprot:gnl/TRDRNA2_/TRDRNA2_99028_c1_seq1.p1 gnl/TRDRNA2_/TRDRNA2_99028_c1~~gnl/TRDRNA2_/TRDRNA2_99028_c1_seq1.p1  ORF type:complete len:351 (-),score=57.42 gnl/TRDRNA2_/TRDRNA2_99028_c1_seq1:63-977(-)
MSDEEKKETNSRKAIEQMDVVDANSESVLRIASFACGTAGGNPAGVAIRTKLPDSVDMQRIAAEVGFSETAFAAKQGEVWRVRYFSPEAEVPFCGHATIALGAALAMKFGDGVFGLVLNEVNITVEGQRNGEAVAAALQSPPTKSCGADANLVARALALFGWTEADLDSRIPPGIAEAGNRHLVLALKKQATLSAMSYNFEAGRDFMIEAGLLTLILVHAAEDQYFHVRNPFAYGGVYEDPATGSAAAAFAGYLRDLKWPHGGHIEILQGEDMGMRSLLTCEIPPDEGASIRVSGEARVMAPEE